MPINATLTEIESLAEKATNNSLSLFFIVFFSSYTITSLLFTRDPLQYYVDFSYSRFLLFFGLSIIATVIGLLYKHHIDVKNENEGKNQRFHVRGVIAAPNGWKNIMDKTHSDVIWIVKVPILSGRFAEYRYEEIPSIVSISTPPRCPKCKTILAERKSFWGDYLWYCPTGDFQKKNKLNFFKESETVRVLAIRDLEKSFEEFNSTGY